MADVLDALERERAAYARRGLPDRAAAVEAEIERIRGQVPQDRSAEPLERADPAQPTKRGRRSIKAELADLEADQEPAGEGTGGD